MKNHFARILVAASFVTLVSQATFGYVLLNPARRWFNADTPRLVRIDNAGVASVTSPDPNRGVTAALNAVTSWNGSGVNVTSSQLANVAYVQGDGISDVKFSDPLHICTGTCLAATLTGYYSTAITGTCGSLTVDKITDADVAFNLSYNYTTPAQGSCSSEIYLDSEEDFRSAWNPDKRRHDVVIIDVIDDINGELSKRGRRLSDGTYRKFRIANVLSRGTSRKVRRAGA
jgi:hypothetical protein